MVRISRTSNATEAKTITNIELLNLVIVLLFFLSYSIFFVYQWRRERARRPLAT